jgi:FG-GAP-like repeat
MTAALASLAGLVAVLVAGSAGAQRSDPSFAANSTVLAGRPTCAAAVADFDGDGPPDLAIENCHSKTLTVLLGDGTGGFRPAPVGPIEVPAGDGLVAAADLNRDRKPDLAVLGRSEIKLLLGDGSGGFSAAPGSPVKIAGTAAAMTLADVNRDDRLDLVVSRHQSERARLGLFLGDGSGRFTRAPDIPLSIGRRWPSPLIAADFNGDARPDLVVGHSGYFRATILLQGAAGGFRAVTTVRRTVLAVDDFNRDGKADLAAANADGDTSRVRALLGTGAGRFRAAGSGIAVGPHGGDSTAVAAAADLDGDRRLDLAVGNYWRGVYVLLGTGAGGRFRLSGDSPFPPASPPYNFEQGGASALLAADLNGDGRPDLVAPGGWRPGGGLTILRQTPPAPVAAGAGSLPGRSTRVFSTRRPISLLAVDGERVAAMTTPVKRACGRIVVWSPPRYRPRSFKTEEGCYDERPTIPPNVTELALGGGQLAWIVEVGGNTLEMVVHAARLSGGRARQIDYANNSNGASGYPDGSWVGRLQGEGPLLVYNGWTLRCTVSPEDGCGWSEPTLHPVRQRLVRIVRGRRAVVGHGASSFPVSAVGGGRMAVEAAGAVTVLGARGGRVAVVPPVEGDPPRGVALSRKRLAVERTFELDLHDPANGRKAKSILLGPAAALRLIGVNTEFALLRGQHRIVLVRLSDGKLASVRFAPRTAGTVVDIKLNESGLFYAYNVRSAKPGGRIVFESTTRLLNRF